MSRIGKKPIELPPGVTVTLSAGKAQARGPKGELHLSIPPDCEVVQTEKTLTVTLKKEGSPAIFGLTRALLNNIIKGVSEGFKKELELVGIGYRAQVQGKKIVLSLGFSNPVEYLLPDGVEAKVAGNQNLITLSGADKQKVGQTAAEIRKIRPPEPYQGKGVKYLKEAIRRKAGKAMGGGTATAAK